MVRPVVRLLFLSFAVSLVALMGAGGCKKKPKGSADAGAAAPTGAQAGAAPVQTGEGVIDWNVAQLRSTPSKDAVIVANLSKGARVVVRPYRLRKAVVVELDVLWPPKHQHRMPGVE